MLTCHAMRWTNLADIMIHGLSQSHTKANMVGFCLSEVCGVVEFIETGSRMAASRDVGEWKWRL